ncbi:MAG: protein kinase domain-containing protein, partial [Candidatus Eiseniibacteriota bacterium]
PPAEHDGGARTVRAARLALDAPAAPETWIGVELEGRYRLETVLGRGGMGVVYRAVDRRLDRSVAVKMLPNMRIDEESRDRLLGEARAAAALNHPHVVAVHDAGEHHGVPFVVMELVDGESLRSAMPSAFGEIVAAGLQISDALAHAHARGLVHRDLKPENVLVTNSDAGPVLKLADLGLAVGRGGPRLTRTGAITGTAAYMAPEQALGRDIDARADLYALGVMLYEMIAGRLPFEGSDALVMVSQHIHAPVVPPRAHRADVPQELEAVVLRLLAKDPDARPASAAEARAALQDASLSPAAAADTSAAVALLEELARGRLVGRGAELGELRDLWRRATEGRGHLVLLSGEPGAGKTRLARELLVMAQLEGALALAGACYENEAATPYLPFVDALRRWVRACSDNELRSVLGDTAPELARLAPELNARLRSVATRAALSPSEERLLLFDEFAGFLQKLSRRRGLVFYIDDLHWADQGTVSLLSYLLRQLREERILFAASYREVELDRTHPLGNALLDWNRERLSTRITLGRLSAAETRALLATLLGEEQISEEFSGAVYRETEGNPFFVEEVLKSLIENGKVFRKGGRWDRCTIVDLEMPQGVKSAIGQRLNRTDPGHLEALRTAAVIGKQFTFGELAAASPEGDEDALLDALDAAVRAQLVVPLEDEAFVFTHDKIREVLYEELNPIRRRRLHLRVAEGLEKARVAGRGVAIEDLAHHCIEGGDCERGLVFALAAARDAVAMFAIQDAIGLFHRARECADSLERHDAIREIEQAIGDACVAGGERIAAGAHYERALALTVDPLARVKLKCAAAGTYVTVGDPRAITFADEALAELDPAKHPVETADALVIKARFQHLRGQHRDAVALLERALDLAEGASPADSLVFIYAYLAGAHQALADFPTSAQWAWRAIELGERTGRPICKAVGYEFLAEANSITGPFEEGIEFARIEQEIVRPHRSREREGWSLMAEGFCWIGCGNLQEADRALQTSLQLARQVGEARLEVFALNGVARVAADDGRVDEALELAVEAADRADRLGLVHMRAVGRYTLAHVALARKEWAKALAWAEEVEDILQGTDIEHLLLQVRPLHVRALLALGRRDEARRRLDQYAGMLRTRDFPPLVAVERALRDRLDAGEA